MFTDDLDLFYQQGGLMCWPFQMVRKPPGMRGYYVIFTFDGTNYAVYEDDKDSYSSCRAKHQPRFTLTRNPDEQDQNVSAVLRVSEGGQPVAVIPIFRAGAHDAILWRSGIWIAQESLSNLYVTAGDSELRTLYVQARD